MNKNYFSVKKTLKMHVPVVHIAIKAPLQKSKQNQTFSVHCKVNKSTGGSQK